jgi:hypothetical protein
VKIARRSLIEGALVACAGCVGREPPASQPTQNIQHEESTPMNSRLLMTLRLTTATPQALGAGPRGTRTTFPITGGTFEGPRLRGKVLGGGGDWAILRADGVLELDLRATLETDDGALIHMTFEGLRQDPYFRTTSRFETGAPKYEFLNRLLAVGTGEIRADGPVHTIEEIL